MLVTGLPFSETFSFNSLHYDFNDYPFISFYKLISFEFSNRMFISSLLTVRKLSHSISSPELDLKNHQDGKEQLLLHGEDIEQPCS